MVKYLYLLVVLGAFALPFMASFSRKFPFVKFWRGVFFGIGVMLLVFLPWEYWLISKGVIGFNPEMIIGTKVGNIPWESILYLIAIPFAFCYFYEWLNKRTQIKIPPTIERRTTAAIIFVCFVLSIVCVQQLFTFTTCSLLCLFLIWHLLVMKSDYLGRFYLAFLLFQLPLFLIKSLMTGLFTNEAIMWYKTTEHLGVTMLTLPLESMAFDMLMLLIVITAHENFKVKGFSGALNVSQDLGA